MFNSFGNIFRLTSFGESHGKGVGGVIDGFPSGITIDDTLPIISRTSTACFE